MKFTSHRLCSLFTAALLFTLSASAQEKGKSDSGEPPRPAASFNAQEVESESTPQYSLLVEFFELDHRAANKLVSQFSPRAADAGELREILDKKVQTGEAELLETGWLRGLSGNRTKLESIHEHIYPTEYDPAEIPNIAGGNVSSENPTKVGEKKGDPLDVPDLSNNGELSGPAIHFTSATPSAFETRNLGLTIEADVIVSRDRQTIDVNAAIERTERVGDRYFTKPGSEDTAYGIDHISMPNFYVMVSTNQFTAIPGRTNLVAFHTPYHKPDRRILCLVTTESLLAGNK